MCARGLFAQCETTQNRGTGKGASLFGYTELYGSVPGGQAEFLRVPQAHFGPIKVPRERPTKVPLPLRHPAHRVAGSEVCGPSLGWHPGRVRTRSGGPVLPPGSRVISARHGSSSIDNVRERLEMARRHCIEVIDTNDVDDVAAMLLELTGGRGPDSVVDAVGMEAHDSPAGKLAHAGGRCAARRWWPNRWRTRWPSTGSARFARR